MEQKISQGFPFPTCRRSLKVLGACPPPNTLAMPLLKLAFEECQVRSPSATTLGVLRCLLGDGMINPAAPLPEVVQELNLVPSASTTSKLNQAMVERSMTTTGDFLVAFLHFFLHWVPHSIEDDTM